jgi:hypothetical protein
MGVEAIDLSTPLSPSHVASYHSLEPNHIPIYGRIFSIDVDEATHTLVALDDKGMLVFDSSDLLHPALQSYTDFQGRAAQVRVIGTTVYAAASWTGFLVADVSNRQAPNVKCHFNPAYYVEGVDVKGTEAYLLCTDDKVRVYDVSNPTTSCGDGQVLGEVTMTGTGIDNRFAGLTVSGEHLYVAGYKGGLFVYHIDSPGHLSLVHQSNVVPTSQDIRVQGTFAYVTDPTEDKLYILDVTNPASPQIVHTEDVQAAGAPRPVGSTLLMAGAPQPYASGLYLYDITTPSAPTLKARYQTDFEVQSPVLTPSNVYVGCYGDGLRTMTIGTLQKLGAP